MLAYALREVRDAAAALDGACAREADLSARLADRRRAFVVTPGMLAIPFVAGLLSTMLTPSASRRGSAASSGGTGLGRRIQTVLSIWQAALKLRHHYYRSDSAA